MKQLSGLLATKDEGLNNLYKAIKQASPSPRKVSPKQVAYALERMR